MHEASSKRGPQTNLVKTFKEVLFQRVVVECSINVSRPDAGEGHSNLHAKPESL